MPQPQSSLAAGCFSCRIWLAATPQFVPCHVKVNITRLVIFLLSDLNFTPNSSIHERNWVITEYTYTYLVGGAVLSWSACSASELPFNPHSLVVSSNGRLLFLALESACSSLSWSVPGNPNLSSVALRLSSFSYATLLLSIFQYWQVLASLQEL